MKLLCLNNWVNLKAIDLKDVKCEFIISKLSSVKIMVEVVRPEGKMNKFNEDNSSSVQLNSFVKLLSKISETYS